MLHMKLYKSILAAAAVIIGAAGVTGCQDHFDEWDLSAPAADIQANTTILEFKQAFWQESTNYCVEIPEREDGSHYIVKGRVISSDREGNVFKCLYIQDETAALPISINQYSLYVNNRVGQEILIDLTGLYCGRYSGMFQIGAIQYDDKTGDAGTTFLDPEIFTLHRQLNGNPEPEKIDTIVIEDVSGMTGDPMKWQGQLVRFNNATFTNANNPSNDQLCNVYQSSGYNQALTGKFGDVNVRTSGYSDFWNTKLPKDACDVVGIAGYYASSGTPWQIILNDAQGIMNIGNPTAEGIKTQPYTVERAIELSAANNVTGWVQGYIVGTIQPEITSISSNADIQWVGTAPFIVDNYLVIAPSPETRDYTQCLLVPIATNSALYTYGNLAEHPDNAGRTLNIYGRFSTSMGMAALAGNDGTPTSFVLQGVDVPGSDEPDTPIEGDGTKESPYTVAQAIAKNSGTAWVKGYIVGTNSGDPDYKFETSAPFTLVSNVYIADSPNETNEAKMMPVQLTKGTEICNAINLVNNPDNLGKVLAVEGSIERYFGQPGLKSLTAYELDGSGSGGGGSTPVEGGTEDDPYSVSEALSVYVNGKVIADVWVEGYIIGSSNAGAVFTPTLSATGASGTNIIIAESADETDPTKMLPVQLPAGDVRTNLNLNSNPDLFGKKVELKGSIEVFFNRAGLKGTSAYKLL